MTCRSLMTGCELKQVKQQRRRNVVGQIADDAQRARSGVRARRSRTSAHRLRARLAARAARRGVGSAAASSRSISTTCKRSSFSQSGIVIAPRAAADFDHRVARRRPMASTIRRMTAGSCRKCWPSASSRARQAVDAARSRARRPRTGCSGRARPVPARCERRAVIDRRAHDRQPERHVDDLAEARALSTGRPWSWYIATTASQRASDSGMKAVSAETGPSRRGPRAASARTAGSMIALPRCRGAALAGVRIEPSHQHRAAARCGSGAASRGAVMRITPSSFAAVEAPQPPRAAAGASSRARRAGDFPASSITGCGAPVQLRQELGVPGELRARIV